MKSVQKYQTRTHFVSALIAVAIPATYWVLWIYSFNKFDSSQKRIEYFYRFFPDFLTGTYVLPLLVIMFCVLAMVLASRGISSNPMQKRFLNITISIASGCIMLLTVVSLM